MLRRIPIVILAFVATALLFAGVANAQTFKGGDNTTVTSGETIQSAAYLAGNTVDVAGTINGDLYCAGQTVTISGTVNGDIFCAGQTITFSGTASGSVRLAGQTVNITGKVTNATIFAQTATLSGGTEVTQDLNGAAQTLTIADKAVVGRDITYAANTIDINGYVVRDVKVTTEQLTLGAGSTISGNVAYTSVNGVKTSDGLVIGKITQTIPKEEPKQSYSFGLAGSLMVAFYMFASVLLLLIVLAALFPSAYKESAARVGTSPWTTILIGFVALVTMPILLLFVAFTIIGLPIALLLGMLWLVVLMLSGSFSSYYIGSLLLKKQKNAIVIMLAGGTLLLVLYIIPIVGFFVAMVSTMLGTGIILREVMKRTPSTK